MTALRLVKPAPPNARHPNLVRRPNAVLRTREHLTQSEVEALMETLKRHSRQPHRDATMILTAYRHGLRASEIVDLRWDQIDFSTANMHVRRIKGSTPSTHPIMGDELRMLRRLQREQDPRSPFVFVSQRGAPMDAASYSRMVQRAGVASGLDIKVHAHMLRHGCGYALANKGVDTRALQGYLGHKDIGNTVRYTELSPNRFANFWR